MAMALEGHLQHYWPMEVVCQIGRDCTWALMVQMLHWKLVAEMFWFQVQGKAQQASLRMNSHQSQ